MHCRPCPTVAVRVTLPLPSSKEKPARAPAMPGPLNPDARPAALHAAGLPRFSHAQMARRPAARTRVMDEAGVDHLPMCGEQRAGTGVAWLTSWPATVEAYVIVAPGEPQLMDMVWEHAWTRC